MKNQLLSLAAGALLASAAACDIDVPDLNNPGLGPLEETPTAVSVEAACTGLLIGNRGNQAAANGYILQLGVLGREAYNFDTADPRFVGELLAGRLQPGSPFGGNFWAGSYNNIRLANVTLKATDKLSDAELSAMNKSSIKGFINTTYALDLLYIINTHDKNGAVIDTDQPIVLPPAPQPLGAIVSKDLVFAEIAKRLDDGAAGLAGAGTSFPFLLSSGYAGFSTPASYLKYNRALKARVLVYQKKYAEALTALGDSFIDDDNSMGPVDLQLGVYNSYSTKTGDGTNGLINPNIYANNTLTDHLQKNGAANDKRYDAKIVQLDEPASVTDTPLSTDIGFQIYTSPSSPTSIIRNEELILLKAEALWFTGDKVNAMIALNLVRTQSGGLAPIAAPPASDAAFIDALLYEREYSLMFEGHRWIDLRRFDRLNTIQKEDPTYVINSRYPIPTPECNARPGEAACSGGTTD